MVAREGRTLRVAAAQMDVALGEVDRNLAEALRILADAQSRAVQLLVFPELALSGYCLGDAAGEPRLSLVDERLRLLASAAGETTVAIGLAERVGADTYNSVALLQHGHIVFVQRKLTLPTYDRFDEKRHFRAGQRLQAFDLLDSRAAVLICNDAWHPALAFLAVQDGAEILLVPANSATPTDGGTAADDSAEWEHHWADVVRFHARIQQTFVIYSNRVGREGHISFYGGSVIVGPDGAILAAARRFQPDLVVADLDLTALRKLRRRFALQQDARLELITQELARLGSQPKGGSGSSLSPQAGPALAPEIPCRGAT